MKVHLVYAHPLDSSFAAAALARVRSALEAAGHSIDLLDLYAEDFEPRLSAAERRVYHDVPDNRAGVQPYVDRLQAAEALVLVFPAWNFGPPAILKGWFDRVMLPGVSFDLRDGRIRPALTNIRRFAVVTSYGQQGWIVRWIIGDPLRKQLLRAMRRCMNPRARTRWHACYDMNNADDKRRARFLDRLDRSFRSF
ncbi:MAG: NAD(P)H-dependent oxidoreductase [Alphaproteobacteria bacterium]